MKAVRLDSTRDSIFESRDLLAFFSGRRDQGSLILVSNHNPRSITTVIDGGEQVKPERIGLNSLKR